jgi:ADP-ribosylglycohydrolase
MAVPIDFESKILQAWQGRISGCMLGKAVETFSMREGHAALHSYLDAVDALPLRDYIPFDAEHASPHLFVPCCRNKLDHSLADDDINYSVLALMLLETHGAELTTTDVARAWLKWLPVASTFTAERAAYKILLTRGHEWFPEGRPLGFEITECADNPYNDWIGAQIRADVYGWVCPGKPELAAQLAAQDAALSHRGEGIFGAVFIATLGALLAGGDTIEGALEQALQFIPADSDCAEVVQRAHLLRDNPDGGNVLREQFPDMSVVHTINNLGLVVWALTRFPDDFDAAIGDVVAAGLDTDCNGATVGALWALQGKPIPSHWTTPWQNKVGVSLAGMAELDLDSLVNRTCAVAHTLA